MIVKKCSQFALIFSKLFGIALVKPNVFESQYEFDRICDAGNWVKTNFVRVDDPHEKLHYKYMAIPPFEERTTNVPITRSMN